jgi:hypothetical protein
MSPKSGELTWRLSDREIEIVHELQVKVLEYEKLLVTCVHICSKLDWYVRYLFLYGERRLIGMESCVIS